MVDNILSFILVMITATTMENVVFTRALGVNKIVFQIKDIKSNLRFGAIVTLVITLANIINYPLNILISERITISYLKSITFVFSIIITYILINIAFMLFNKSYYAKAKIMISMASFNCCVHGVLIISSIQKLNFLTTIAYSLGSGLGFIIALLMIYIGKQRISMLNVPRAFKGLPIILLYLGILSLAIYGLIGHQLPS